jgi:mRNA interferase MazF
LGISIVCPLTSKIKNYAGCLILNPDKENGLDQKSEIITFQIRTLSQQRLKTKIGEVTAQQLEDIKTGLNEILAY